MKEWNIRITNVSDLHATSFIDAIGGRTVAVREGAPYDPDVQPHIHIYAITDKSESFIRKKIQQLDTERKGNALYSMSSAHDNTPNYVLKKIFEDTAGRLQQTLEHPRLIYHTPEFLELNYGKWYNQYEKYLNAVKQDKAIRKRIKKSSTMEMIIEIADKWKDEPPTDPNWFIADVVEWHQSRDLLMPSRSNMERYIITILKMLHKDPKYLDAYYSVNFYRN